MAGNTPFLYADPKDCMQHTRPPYPSPPSQSLLKFLSLGSVMPSSHLVLRHPLLLLPSIFPSIRVFSNESALFTRWPKYWSFRLSISPFNENSGFISFRIAWFDLLAAKGTLRILLQYRTVQKHQFFGGIICICEAVDISPGNLDSSLCFIQPNISLDVLCI